MKRTSNFLWATVSISLLLVLSSCTVSKIAREQQSMINGTWTLANIDYENNDGAFSSILFGDAKDICFEGSQWFFRNNNSTGQYSIKAGSLCQGGDRYIRWSVVEATTGATQLQFKFIDEKMKDIAGGTGYRLNIAKLTANEMILKTNVAADGEPVTVVYEFTR